MSVALLIITHDHIGESLVASATGMLGKNPMITHVLDVCHDCDPDALFNTAKRFVENQQEDGVLILTDIYGSTPSNIAARLSSDKQAMVIAGLNLPMLVRILNYPQLSLSQLAAKALSGGHDGVFLCRQEHSVTG